MLESFIYKVSFKSIRSVPPSSPPTTGPVHHWLDFPRNFLQKGSENELLFLSLSLSSLPLGTVVGEGRKGETAGANFFCAYRTT